MSNHAFKQRITMGKCKTKSIESKCYLLEAATGDILRKAVLKHFTKFTGKHICNVLVSLFNKVAGLKGCVHYIFASLLFKSKREHFSN